MGSSAVTGLVVAAAVLVVATVFGVWRNRHDGRLRPVAAGAVARDTDTRASGGREHLTATSHDRSAAVGSNAPASGHNGGPGSADGREAGLAGGSAAGLADGHDAGLAGGSGVGFAGGSRVGSVDGLGAGSVDGHDAGLAGVGGSVPAESVTSGALALPSDDRPATLATDSTHPAVDRTLLDLGVDPATPVTLLQFSSAFCAPCRVTRRVLADVAAMVDGVTHLEVDAESHLDAVRALDIWRTPTTLIVAGGRVVQRASGVPAKAQVVAAVAPMIDQAER